MTARDARRGLLNTPVAIESTSAGSIEPLPPQGIDRALPARRYCVESYRGLLRTALDEGWRFRRFTEAPEGESRAVCLRHDVDYSMGMALELARINQSLGVSGTFCLQLRSPIYNLLEARSLQQARRIHAAGQSLGLHCRIPDDVNTTAEDLSLLVRREFELLWRELPMVERVFSWHNPTPAAMELAREIAIDGLINAYGRQFTEAIVYRSDSNMRHSVADLEAVLRDRGVRGLQLLLHPVNWIAGGADMIEVLANAWSWVVREREVEFLTNRTYRRLLPAGIPQTAIEAMVRACRDAANVTPQAPGSEHHVTLAPLRPADSNALFRWINDRALVVLSAPYRPVPRSEHDAWFESIQRRVDVAIFGIRRIDNDQLIGSCQLLGIDSKDRSAELRIRIGEPSARGRGWGTQAVDQLLFVAFTTLKLDRVHLQVLDGNVPAERLYHSAGFRDEGLQQDTVLIEGRPTAVRVMSLSRDEYDRRHPPA